MMSINYAVGWLPPATPTRPGSRLTLSLSSARNVPAPSLPVPAGRARCAFTGAGAAGARAGPEPAGSLLLRPSPQDFPRKRGAALLRPGEGPPLPPAHPPFLPVQVATTCPAARVPLGPAPTPGPERRGSEARRRRGRGPRRQHQKPHGPRRPPSETRTKGVTKRRHKGPQSRRGEGGRQGDAQKPQCPRRPSPHRPSQAVPTQPVRAGGSRDGAGCALRPRGAVGSHPSSQAETPPFCAAELRGL